jgi:hypothetical protein
MNEEASREDALTEHITVLPKKKLDILQEHQRIDLSTRPATCGHMPVVRQ